MIKTKDKRQKTKDKSKKTAHHTPHTTNLKIKGKRQK